MKRLLSLSFINKFILLFMGFTSTPRVKKILLVIIIVVVFFASILATSLMLGYRNQLVAALQSLFSSTPGTITSLTLINADTDKPVPGYENVGANVVLNFATLPTRNLNVIANTAGSIGSIVFSYDTNTSAKVEGTAPYAFAGDNYPDYLAWTPTLGAHTITATSYSRANGEGTRGGTVTFNFTAIDVAVPNEIGTISLVNTDTQRKVSGFSPLADGAVIDMNTLGKNFNILVEPTDSEIAKIQFGYDTNPNFRTEATAPYTFAGDSGINKLTAWTPTEGNHTLTVTAFKQSNGVFIPGTPKVIRFSVIAVPVVSTPLPPPSTPNQSTTKIDSVFLFNADTKAPISAFNPLREGAVVDVSQLPTRNLGIQALAASTVSEVRFTYDGTQSIQLDPPYEYPGTTARWTPASGNHTITATPYSIVNGVATAGTPTTINFSAIAPAIAETPVVYIDSENSINSGGSITITWSSVNATSCSASGDWDSTQPLSGRITFSGITSSKTFKLTCTGPGGSATSTTTTTVNITPSTDPVSTDTRCNAAGYTNTCPKGDSRVIYVSSSQGDDSNNGSINNPVKTISKGFSLTRDGYPDQVLLKKGDTWNGTVTNYTKSTGKIDGRSSSERFVLGSYGTGNERPFVSTPGQNGSQLQFGTEHFVITGIHFAGAFKGNGLHVEGINNGLEDIVIEDCFIEKYDKGISISAAGSTVERDSSYVSKDIRIRRNVIVDNYSPGRPQGIYIFGADGILIEDNVVDNNGHRVDGSGGDDEDHNIYINGVNWNLTVRNNVIANGSATGLQARPGGIVDGNFFYNNPIHLTYGLVNGGGHPYEGGVTGSVTNNVMIGTRPINSGAHPGDRGVGIDISNIKQARVANNIIAYNTDATGFPGISLSVGTGNYQDLQIGVHNLTLENNIVYKWPLSFQTSRLGADAKNQYSADNIILKNNYLSGNIKVNASLINVNNISPVRSLSKSTDTVPNFRNFITEARKQSKDNWRSAYTAAAANNTIKAQLQL